MGIGLGVFGEGGGVLRKPRNTPHDGEHNVRYFPYFPQYLRSWNWIGCIFVTLIPTFLEIEHFLL